MPDLLNDTALVEEKLKELEHLYNTALHSGKKFSVLKDIRNKINVLLQQLPLDSNGANGHSRQAGQNGHSIG